MKRAWSSYGKAEMRWQQRATKGTDDAVRAISSRLLAIVEHFCIRGERNGREGSFLTVSTRNVPPG